MYGRFLGRMKHVLIKYSRYFLQRQTVLLIEREQRKNGIMTTIMQMAAELVPQRPFEQEK